MSFILNNILLPVATSYLANVIPPFWRPKLEAKIRGCFNKALLQWNEAASERYEGKEEEMRGKLLEYLRHGKTENPEMEELLTNWIVAMKNDPECYKMILESKLDALRDQVSGIGSGVDALGGKVSGIGSSVDALGDQMSGIGVSIDALEEQVIRISAGVDALGGQVLEISKDIVERIDRKFQSLAAGIDKVGEKVDEVRDAVDAGNENGRRILEGVKSILSALSLSLFDCFNDCIRESRMLPDRETSATKLTDNSFWKDEARMDMVMKGLKEYGYFAIKGSEGRGKSILSYQVAYRLIESEGFTVFISQRSWTWNSVCAEMDRLMKVPGAVLFVLENIHQAEDTSTILQYFRDHRGYAGHKRLFLANTRLTDENESGSELNAPDCRYVLNLDVHQYERAVMTAKHLAASSGLNIDELTVDKKNALLEKMPSNLRVLSRYFQIYNREEGVTDVDENKILHLFSTRFGLNKGCTMLQKDCLMKLAAVNIFDIPLYQAGISSQEYDTLQTYKGLCYEQEGKLFLPHSSDAAFLCKTLCDKLPKGGQDLGAVYKKTVTDTVVKYIDVLIRSYDDLTDIERESVSAGFLTFTYNLRQTEFSEALTSSFKDPERAKKIIQTIGPNYIAVALVSDPGKRSEEVTRRLGIYKDSIGIIKGNLSRFSFAALSSLFRVMKHYEGYEGDLMVQELFGDIKETDFRNWLLKQEYLYKDQLFRALNQLPACKEVIKEIYYFYPTIFWNRKFSNTINIYHGALIRVLNDLKSGNVAMEDICARVSIIVKEVKDIVCPNPGQTPSQSVSYILRDLGEIDKKCGSSFKLSLMNDDSFILDAMERLDFFGFEEADFFYFAHFYNEWHPEIRDNVKEKIDKANDNVVLCRMAHYVSFIRNAFQTENKKINRGAFDEGSLAYDIEDKVLTEARARLAPFSYSFDDFFYFSNLFNGAYPVIKADVYKAITNVADDWKRTRMRRWVERVRQSIASKKRDTRFVEGSLAAAIEKELNSQSVVRTHRI